MRTGLIRELADEPARGTKPPWYWENFVLSRTEVQLLLRDPSFVETVRAYVGHQSIKDFEATAVGDHQGVEQ